MLPLLWHAALVVPKTRDEGPNAYGNYRPRILFLVLDGLIRDPDAHKLVLSDVKGLALDPTLARAGVSIALLALAGFLAVVSPGPTSSQLAGVIVGAVAGYWLSHAETTIANAANTEKRP